MGNDTTRDFKYQEFEPGGSLRPFVSCTFLARGRIGYETEKILPTGQIAMIFSLGADHLLGKTPVAQTAHRSWLEGLQTTPVFHTPTDGTHVVGVLFTPLGFHALFGTNMSTLVDAIVPVGQALPEGCLAAIQEAILINDPAASHAALHEVLTAVPARALPAWLWSSHAQIVSTDGAIALETLHAGTGHSARHTTQWFKKAIGVSPKVLCRIHRLLALLNKVDPAAEVNWTSLAHDFGFYDQPHFNRDFRKLTGLFPSEYLTQRRLGYPGLTQGEHVVFTPLV